MDQDLDGDVDYDGDAQWTPGNFIFVNLTIHTIHGFGSK